MSDTNPTWFLDDSDEAGNNNNNNNRVAWSSSGHGLEPIMSVPAAAVTPRAVLDPTNAREHGEDNITVEERAKLAAASGEEARHSEQEGGSAKPSSMSREAKNAPQLDQARSAPYVWTAEKKELLLKLVCTYGNDFEKIQYFFSGCDENQCRMAYDDMLAARKLEEEKQRRDLDRNEKVDAPKHGDWTLQQMQDFHTAYQKEVHKETTDWDAIARHVGRAVDDVSNFVDEYYLHKCFDMMSDFLNVPRRNHASDEKAASSPVLADTNDSARNETVPKKRGGRNPRSKYWTDAERQLLLQRHKALFPTFEKHEEKLFEKIAVYMPGRTGSACKQHYKNVLMKKREAPAPKTKKHTRTAGIDAAIHLESDDSGAPRAKRPKTEAGHGCKRGRWGDDEKRTFDELFSEFGTVWSKCEGRVPGRNAVSCKTHYNKTYQCLKNANADADASGDISDGGDTSGFVSENHHSERLRSKRTIYF